MTRISLKTRAIRRAALVLTMGSLGLLTGIVTAQDAIGPFISTVGTTVRERGTGRDWAYLLWTANTPDLLNGQAHAIYSKPGDANSTAPFTRIAIVSLQTEAITLTPLLGRAALLGEDTNSLHADIDALFGNFAARNLSLPEKLSAIVRGALKEEKHYGRLILLSRVHPSVAMALGYGHATLIAAGQTTFEVREFDRTKQSDGAVIGRVTVTAGFPVVLPAPGPPVELPRDNPRGHLNAQLRWGVPDPLRRLSLLQHGFDVWRVRKDFAQARNWHTTPPPAEALSSNSVYATNVRRINRLPLLTPKTFTLSEAANVTPPTGDQTTLFVIDDNERGNSNIITTLDFTNGARFLYFVTARDILGRDGLVSQGTEVQICNKLPPDALSGVEVVNDSQWINNANRQRLRVTWPQAINAPLAEQQIKAYWVYRWTNVTEMRLKQANRSNNLISVVSHIPGQATNSYLDAGATAPTPPADLGRTFWYTVRAEDDGACSANLSAHSAPVFGVLRDRTGPNAPTGSVAGVCYDPVVDLLGKTTNGSPAGPDDSTFQFTVTGIRTSRLIDWMEFRADVQSIGSTNVVTSFASGRIYFTGGFLGSFASYSFDVPGDRVNNSMSVTATAGFANGESGSVTIDQTIFPRLLDGDQRLVLLFKADLVPQRKDQPCSRHFAVGPGDVLQPIVINLQPSASSKEVRVYRRVDDGPLDLIYQRPLTNLAILTIPDDAFPHGGGRICYFASTLDEHGNASPLTELGCKLAFETSPPPRPQLSPIEAVGSEGSPQMVLSWFCPSVNVDRFEVGIAAVGGEINSNCAPGYLQMIPHSPIQEIQPVSAPIAAAAGIPLVDIAPEFTRFRTPRPGAAFGENDQFTFPVDIETGRHYIVYVRSIAKSGAHSDRSALETFYWEATIPPQPEVPWPARPMPPVGNSFGLSFDALFMPSCGSTNLPGVPTVRIGYQGQSLRGSDCPFSLVQHGDPNTLLPTNGLGETILPIVLYRQQVTNTAFPVVSGDLVQVSPMMESIAWGTNGNQTVIYDPYVLVAGGITINSPPAGIFLRDTQPVISGSRYRYFLVRFNRLGEIAEVIPAANELEAP